MPGRLLLHLCCGPCAIHPARVLAQEGFQVTGLFFNPNIHPLTEYLRRREAALRTAEILDIPVLFPETEYAPETFFRAVAGREQDRCGACYALRLGPVALVARDLGFAYFSTSLLYSKYQKHEAIARAGTEAGAEAGVEFVYRDFRAGWKEGVTLSKQWGIYRQQYCGCLYSEAERYARDLERARAAG